MNNPAVRMAATGSDLVIVAHDVSNTSALSLGNRFVFTDSELVIDEIWKAGKIYPEVSNLAAGSEITVANPGGTVMIESHKLTELPSNVVPLQIGHRYLLFLKYVPASSSFVNSSLSGYDISGKMVIPLRTTEQVPAKEFINNVTSFTTALHSSVLNATSGGRD